MFSSISPLKGERKILQMNICLQLWCRWELYNFWSFEPSYLNERQLVQDGFHFTCVLVKDGKLDYLFIITGIVLANFLDQSFSILAAWRNVDLNDDWGIAEVKVHTTSTWSWLRNISIDSVPLTASWKRQYSKIQQ